MAYRGNNHRGGAPTKYTEALAAEICRRMAGGQSSGQACQELGLHRDTARDSSDASGRAAGGGWRNRECLFPAKGSTEHGDRMTIDGEARELLEDGSEG
jgi:hypothetical protein